MLGTVRNYGDQALLLEFNSTAEVLAWTDTLIRVPTVTAHQDGALIGRRRLPWAASPGRVFRIPAGLIAGRDPRGGPITVAVR